MTDNSGLFKSSLACDQVRDYGIEYSKVNSFT